MNDLEFSSDNIPLAIKAIKENDYLAAKKLLAIACGIAKHIAGRFPNLPAEVMEVIDYYADKDNDRYQAERMMGIAQSLNTIAAYNAQKPYNAFRKKYHGNWNESMRSEDNKIRWQAYRKTQIFEIIVGIARMAKEINKGEIKDAVETFDIDILTVAPSTLLRLEHEEYIDTNTMIDMMDDYRDYIWELISEIS